MVILIDRVGRRYGCRPSEIIGIGNRSIAMDFDMAVAVRAERIERGGFTDPRLVKERQREGCNAVRVLQERIRNARR